ncbi:MAG TPA: S8 family serine peptidase [Acidimicrobiales bacterium]|jgi:hypothetical protein|nr:S8 family serine peptidase [Acidimicrobiales bacterium]
MQKHSLRSWLTIAAVPMIGLAMTLPATDALGASTARPSATAPAHLSGASTKVIVFLRDTLKGFAPRSAARMSALRSEEAPLLTELRASGAQDVQAARVLPFIVATVTPTERAALMSNRQVLAVEPDSLIREPSPMTSTGPTSAGASKRPAVASSPSICGTATNPELDPEALSVIKADQATAAGYTGAGVTVAYIADGVDPTNPDFQRNAAYASAGSPAGTPILTQVNFSGDPAGTKAGGGEAFLDSSSIAAQGNTVYDLSSFVNAAHPTPSTPCDIKIVGAAPGASVMGLDVFSTDYDTTQSNFLQAIDYAVANGVKVINESFGANNFPDTSLDATRLADDEAVAAGVTVVVSSGDAGVTSTLGSPSTDPNLISVGASTTFRSYAQTAYGGINAPAANGTWINNNISSLSSGGFSMAGGNTVSLVAPGDLNWALCDANTSLFVDCSNDNLAASPIEQTGGTSESSPLTAAAAADVIQAYASTHAGTDPSPALVKQILVSSATDISAPAVQQGAGLLNVLAAAQLAASITGTSGPALGGLLIGPNQINLVQKPKASTSTSIKVTNTGATAATVDLSTRGLTKVLSTPSGSFCLNPSTSTSSCGPPTANSFPIWSGVTEVYQQETFSVPSHASRLNFSADYPYTGQASLLHVALIDPSGSYAGYSLPQGLADYANVEVANPTAGTWTAVFFTEKDAGTSLGTSGTIQWFAANYQFQPAGTISPKVLTIPAGGTKSAVLAVKSPAISGDESQSVVLRTVGGATNTIPVTVRTLVAVGKSGGKFTGWLTGGNGRGNPAKTSTYEFAVPAGERDLDVSAHFADINDGVVAYLVDPNGQAVASSSSVTTTSTSSVITTGAVNVYKDSPQAGTWSLVLDWLQPVSGSELFEPFTGTVKFNQVSVSSNLPKKASLQLVRGKAYTFHVTVKNTGLSPQAFFLDPRTTGTQAYRLLDLFGSDQNMSLPLPPGINFPIYSVPADTSNLVATVAGSVPVTFDTGPFTGDPDLSPAVPAPNVVTSQSATSESLTFSAPEIMPGIWYLNPSEYGPYGTGGAPPAEASASMFAVTKGFNSTVQTPTGDLWADNMGLASGFAPKYVVPGATATISFTITPTAPSGTQVTGRINVSDTFLANELIGLLDTGGDQLASLPFTYTVK